MQRARVYFAASFAKCDPDVRRYFSSNDIISYNNVISNVGNGLNSTTGTFKTPVSGVYQFTFTGRFTVVDSENYIVVRKNGKNAYYFSTSVPDTKSTNDYTSLGVNWFMSHKKNDEIYIIVSNDGSKIDSYCKVPVFFSGVLMEEN